ncbi:hypothetical protein ACERK3_02260 [Phycisphaerales bacterium AB-hyl4]|uniref:Uncharacterized protein n=1 Tax=Natronomicrosphaera hydrolytica TaxID=3242702 RepID=A0ABV4U0I0_9BACT
MSRPKRRNDTGDYGEHHVRILRTGCDWFGEFPCDTERRRAWEVLRDDLLPEWIADHPGTRPWAWWRYDAPERRQRVDGPPHPFDNPERIEHIEHIASKPKAAGDYKQAMYRLYYGRPASLCVLDDFHAVYETEVEYLSRLDLLTADEVVAIAAMEESR